MSRGLSNDGLIDGQYASYRQPEQSRRIYGDTVAIRAGELVNTAGAQGGAVIAPARQPGPGHRFPGQRAARADLLAADLRIGAAGCGGQGGGAGAAPAEHRGHDRQREAMRASP
ncbi:hypothetical protein WJ970_21175 [Achromobacter xylosoxidans]